MVDLLRDLGRSARGLPNSVLAGASLVLVAPFASITADTALDRLGRDLVVTLTTVLDGMGFPRAGSEVDRARTRTDGLGSGCESADHAGADHPRATRTWQRSSTRSSCFALLGGGGMGDMGQPLPASRLAVLPATSHTAVITRTDLLHALIEPFLRGETPKGMWQLVIVRFRFGARARAGLCRRRH